LILENYLKIKAQFCCAFIFICTFYNHSAYNFAGRDPHIKNVVEEAYIVIF